jgi:hypothetical protein
MFDSTPPPADPEKALALLSHPAVLKHLDILQGIVGRLAQNSGTCKNWCITLVAGVLVLTFSKDVPDGTRKLVPFIACIPIVIFWAIDAYYHSLERAFRNQSLAFVRSIHGGTFVPSTVLMISDTRSRSQRSKDSLGIAFTTAATTGFYGALIAAVLIVRWLLC